jgi:hypothetical protein
MQLGDAPDVEDAVRGGRISATQAAVLTPAVVADPSSAAELIGLAEKGSLNELNERARAIVAARQSEEDARAREARLRARRHLRFGTSLEGAVTIRGELAPIEGAAVRSALERAAKGVFNDARREGRRESHEAYMADALYDLCVNGAAGAGESGAGEPSVGDRYASADPPEAAGDCEPLATASAGDADPLYAADERASGDGTEAEAEPDPPPGPTPSTTDGRNGDTSPRAPSRDALANPGDAGRRKRKLPPAEVVLHVDLEALRRGHLEPGERCEIAGVGPVPLSTVEYLFPNAWLKIMIEKGVDVLSITHLGRGTPAHLETAVRKRQRFCAVPGCGIDYGLQCDHIVPVNENGPTELANLVLLCHRHHYLKTNKFWRLTGEFGNYQWVCIKPEPGGSAESDAPDPGTGGEQRVASRGDPSADPGEGPVREGRAPTLFCSIREVTARVQVRVA